MLDPATLGLLIGGIKTAATVVRKGIQLKNDASELTSALADLFDKKETLTKEKKKATSGGVKNSDVMKIVMAEREAKETLAQLKKELYWGRPDGADIWKDFWALRAKMIRERKEARQRAIAHRQRVKDMIATTAIIGAIVAFGGAMAWYLISLTIDMGRSAGKW
tara:strand:- start:1164 stop:1655 length:492 start_codon:yes stop_codon:yes gene_type:complete